MLNLVCACALTNNGLADHAIVCEDADGHLDEVTEDLVWVVDAEGVRIVVVSDEPGGYEGAQEDKDREEERGHGGDDDFTPGLG